MVYVPLQKKARPDVVNSMGLPEVLWCGITAYFLFRIWLRKLQDQADSGVENISTLTDTATAETTGRNRETRGG